MPRCPVLVALILALGGGSSQAQTPDQIYRNVVVPTQNCEAASGGGYPGCGVYCKGYVRHAMIPGQSPPPPAICDKYLAEEPSIKPKPLHRLSCMKFQATLELSDPQHPEVEMVDRLDPTQLSGATKQEYVSWEQWHRHFVNDELAQAMMPVLDRYAKEEQLPQQIEFDYTVRTPSTSPTWPRTDTPLIVESTVKVEPSGPRTAQTAFLAAVKLGIQHLDRTGESDWWPAQTSRQLVPLHAVYRINYGKHGVKRGAPPEPELVCPAGDD